MTNPFYSQTNKYTLLQKAAAVIRLTRWREHVPYTIPTVVVGALMSVHVNGLALDWRLLPVLVANILAMSVAASFTTRRTCVSPSRRGCFLTNGRSASAPRCR